MRLNCDMELSNCYVIAEKEGCASQHDSNAENNCAISISIVVVVVILLLISCLVGFLKGIAFPGKSTFL